MIREGVISSGFPGVSAALPAAVEIAPVYREVKRGCTSLYGLEGRHPG